MRFFSLEVNSIIKFLANTKPVVIRVVFSFTSGELESVVDIFAKRSKAAFTEDKRALGRIEACPPSLCDEVTSVLMSNSSS